MELWFDRYIKIKNSWESFKKHYYFKNQKLKYLDIIKTFDSLCARKQYPLFFVPKSLDLLFNREFRIGFNYSKSHRSGLYLNDIIDSGNNLDIDNSSFSYIQQPVEKFPPRRRLAEPTEQYRGVISHKKRRIIAYVVSVLLLILTISSSFAKNSAYIGILLMFVWPFYGFLLWSWWSCTDYFTDGSISGTRRKTLEELKTEQDKLDQSYNQERIEYDEWYKNYKVELFKYRMQQGAQSSRLSKSLDEILDSISDNYHISPKEDYEFEENPQRGVMENKFYTILKRELGDSVKRNVKYLIYYPDICVEVPGICTIDVEIDEPYAFKDKWPTHYIDSEDEKRNLLFRQEDWYVIRFSEKQIKKSMGRCVQIIVDLVTFLKYNNFADIEEVSIISKKISDNRWTFDEAEEMAERNWRNSYL